MSLDWWGYKEKESQQYSKKWTLMFLYLFSFQIIKSIPVALAPLLEDLLSEA